MTPIDAAGHVAYVLMLVGHLLVTKKQAKGFLFRIVGGLMWILLGGFLGLSSIILWGGVFCVLDCYGWYKWWKERDTEYVKTMIVQKNNIVYGDMVGGDLNAD